MFVHLKNILFVSWLVGWFTARHKVNRHLFLLLGTKCHQYLYIELVYNSNITDIILV